MWRGWRTKVRLKYIIKLNRSAKKNDLIQFNCERSYGFLLLANAQQQLTLYVLPRKAAISLLERSTWHLVPSGLAPKKVRSDGLFNLEYYSFIHSH